MTDAKDYTIDPTLYAQALEEIKADFLKGNPMALAVAEAMAGTIAQHAQQSFYTMWQSAIRSHESHKATRSQMQDMTLDAFDEKRLEGLMPEDQERFRRMHQESVEQFKKDNEQRQKLFDAHNRSTLIRLMATAGMSKQTAEKIVDNHILVQKD